VSGEEFRVLAEEQAALRRVATLVAHGAPPEEVFAAVAEEVGRVLPIEYQHLGRFEPDGIVNYVAASGPVEGLVPAGTRLPLGGDNVTTRVFETGRAARTDYSNPASPIGAIAMERSIRWSVGAPIIVEGRRWGIMIVSSTLEHPPPPDTEQRLTQFMELLATAIANTQARTELAASRARIVAAADETRRQIQRDLHDGAQQHLVNTVILQKLALRALQNGDENVGELMAEALQEAEQANSELSELAHGILPAALTRDGLRGALQALVGRIPLPVTAQVSVKRLPASVEATAYFIVSEALTNVLKHAHADHASVTVQAEDGRLRVEIRDDGIGGADPEHGSGLVGLTDRVEALGGTLQLTSPTGSGTTLLIQLPVGEPTGNRTVQH
jgi:signal transduction histidine kinase